MSFSEQLVYMLVAGFLANNVWRWAGVVASRGLDENSEIVRWVRAVGRLAELLQELRAGRVEPGEKP